METLKLSEEQLRDRLLDLLKDIVKPPYKIGHEIPIPYKHIYIPTNNNIKLELWCFAQDITIYQTLFDRSVKHKEAKITKNNQTIIEVILEKDRGQNLRDVGLPFVILELKKEQPNTHEILTYSQKAEMIKTIFPYCQFLFLIQGDISARTYRHGINFDEIISLKDINNENEIKNLKATLMKHFKIAMMKLNKLTETNYKNKNILK